MEHSTLSSVLFLLALFSCLFSTIFFTHMHARTHARTHAHTQLTSFQGVHFIRLAHRLLKDTSAASGGGDNNAVGGVGHQVVDDDAVGVRSDLIIPAGSVARGAATDAILCGTALQAGKVYGDLV